MLMFACGKLQGGIRQQNGYVRWTMLLWRHFPKNHPKKSSALHFAMASFSATSSTESIPVLFSRSSLFPYAVWPSTSYLANTQHLYSWIMDWLYIGGGLCCSCCSIYRRSCSIRHSIFWEYEKLFGGSQGYEAIDVWSFRFRKGKLLVLIWIKV